MSDDQWLLAMAKHSHSDSFSGRRPLAGGANQLGSELQAQAKADPTRFAKLLTRIPTSANPTYVDRILGGLSDAQGVDVDLITSSIQLANARSGGHHHAAIVRLFERHPTIAAQQTMLDLLLWLAEYGEVGDEGNVAVTDAKTDVVTINDLMARASRWHMRGMNSVRGTAAEALEQVLWKVPGIEDQVWPLVERRIVQEELISIRCCWARPLIPLFNSDKPRCAEALKALLRHPDEAVSPHSDDASTAPLVTDAATKLLPYIIAQVPAVGRGLVERLIASSNELFSLIGAWHAIRESYSQSAYTELASKVIDIGPKQKRLAASLAAEAAIHDDFRDRAERDLIGYFNDEDLQTRTQAADVFREVRAEDFREYRLLAEAYVKSKAFDADAWGFLKLLEKGSGNVHHLLVAAGESMVRKLSEAGGAEGRTTTDLHTLHELIRREYAATENDSGLRDRMLNVIDALLEGAHYGSDAIVQDHDR